MKSFTTPSQPSKSAHRTLNAAATLFALVILIAATNIPSHAQTWQPGSTSYSNMLHDDAGAPSAAYFNGNLFVAFTDATTNEIAIAESTDNGETFSNPELIPGTTMPTGDDPVIASFNGKLFVAYECASCSTVNLIYMTYTTDGTDFVTPYMASTSGFAIRGYAPAMTVFDNQLWLAWISSATPGDSGGYAVEYSNSDDGITWPGSASAGTDGWLVPPTLMAYDDTLYIAESQPGTNDLVLGEWTGSFFTGFYTYPSIQVGSRPEMSDSNEGLLIAFKNNSNNYGSWISCTLVYDEGPSGCSTTVNPIPTVNKFSLLDGPGIVFNNGLDPSLFLFYRAENGSDSLLLKQGD